MPQSHNIANGHGGDALSRQWRRCSSPKSLALHRFSKPPSAHLKPLGHRIVPKILRILLLSSASMVPGYQHVDHTVTVEMPNIEGPCHTITIPLGRPTACSYCCSKHGRLRIGETTLCLTPPGDCSRTVGPYGLSLGTAHSIRRSGLPAGGRFHSGLACPDDVCPSFCPGPDPNIPLRKCHVYYGGSKEFSRRKQAAP